jgi:integrase/recombinase XerD
VTMEAPRRGRRTRVALPLEQWPARDRHAWEVAVAQGDPLEPGGLAASWRPASRDNARIGYGRWLGWLGSQGQLDEALAPADRLLPARVGAYVTHLRAAGAASTAAAHLANLAMALRAIVPDHDWSWLQRLVARERRRAEPVRAKRPRLRPTDELVGFGGELMDAAERASDAMSWEVATAYRDGLMVALLALRPLRRRNFVAIEIDRHLVRTGSGYQIRFTGRETKNHAPLDWPFPEELLDRLGRYLDYYRPWLCAQTGNRNPHIPFVPAGARLWVSKCGSALSGEAFYKTLRKRTAARFGRSLHPHLFRDSIATTVAANDPAHIGVIPKLLGHRTPQTAERFYIHAGMIDAARQVSAHIDALRRGPDSDQDDRREHPPSGNG